jgi:hypothetical protein
VICTVDDGPYRLPLRTVPPARTAYPYWRSRTASFTAASFRNLTTFLTETVFLNNSKESIPPPYVAWRAGTANLLGF